MRNFRLRFYFIIFGYFYLFLFFNLSKLRSELGETGKEFLKNRKWRD